MHELLPRGKGCSFLGISSLFSKARCEVWQDKEVAVRFFLR